MASSWGGGTTSPTVSTGASPAGSWSGGTSSPPRTPYVGEEKFENGKTYVWNGTSWVEKGGWKGGGESGNVALPIGPGPAKPSPYDPLKQKLMAGSQPGTGEEWWQQYGYKFGQPSTAQQYWTGQQGYFTGPSAYAPTLEGMAGDARSMTTLGPGAGERFYDTDAWRYDQPGVTEATRLGSLAGLSSPGWAEQFYTGPAQELRAPGTLEDWYSRYGDRFAQPGALSANMGDVRGMIGEAGASAGFGPDALSALGRPGFTEALATGYRPELSYSEEFLTGKGPTGLDALYERQYTKGAESLENRMAAIGAFGSGAGVRATGELLADLTNQRTLNEMQLRQQSDVAKMARFGEARQLMTSADEALRGRYGVGFAGARGMDEVALARARAAQDLYGATSAEDLARLEAGAGVAGRAQEAGLGRMTALGGLAQTAEELDLARARERFGEAEATERTGLERLAGKRTAAELSQRGGLERGRLGLEGVRTGADILRDIEDTEMRRRIAGGQLAGATSEDALRWLAAEFGGAKTTQELTQARQAEDWSKLMGLTGAMAGSYERGTGAISTEQLQLGLQEIEGMLRRGEIDQKDYENRRDSLLALANLGLKAYAAGKTK